MFADLTQEEAVRGRSNGIGGNGQEVSHEHDQSEWDSALRFASPIPRTAASNSKPQPCAGVRPSNIGSGRQRAPGTRSCRLLRDGGMPLAAPPAPTRCCWPCMPWTLVPAMRWSCRPLPSSPARDTCRTGTRPVFADIDTDTYNLDPFQVESKISHQSDHGGSPVGQSADMEPLRQSPSGTNCPLSRMPPSRSVPSTRANGPARWAPSAASASIHRRTWVPTAMPAWSSPTIPTGATHGLPARPRYGAEVLPQIHGLECSARRSAGGHAAGQAAHLDRWTDARQEAARATTP